jgi:FAD/FMN-containing dehydrogenase
MQHDISVPVDDMPRFIAVASAELERAFPGVWVNAYGHLGDGNVHFHVRAPEGCTDPNWRVTTGKAASRMVYDLVAAAGGSISAEHGIGQMKRDELGRLSAPARINALRAQMRLFRILVARCGHNVMRNTRLCEYRAPSGTL